MRLAIFSDIHGQVGRLSACLDAVARLGADELWCLGDAIDGLSARPPELTVACVRAINDVCTVKLAGNHEAWALQDQSLPDAAATLIAGWGVAAQRDGILAVHGSPHNPLMGTDLALLAVSLEASRKLSLRKIADVRVGEFVIAIGSPYGMEGTVTAGIVSGLDRTMPAPNRVPIENMLETDALINPGNSGGPLISLDARVVGVNDQGIVNPETGSSGLGFAIPRDTVRLVYEEIMETGNDYVSRASLSTRTTLRPFTHEERRHYSQKAGAILVADPPASTPGASAGLHRGDIIVSFNGNLVDEPGDLYAALNRKVIGRECELEFLRDEKRHRCIRLPSSSGWFAPAGRSSHGGRRVCHHMGLWPTAEAVTSAHLTHHTSCARRGCRPTFDTRSAVPPYGLTPAALLGDLRRSARQLDGLLHP